ncbi:hypothetical protein ACG0Z6_04780 [Roseateles sp. BYS180W]|uniref:DUF342 domain-containing protein n=1 Tax=Roseateles rivi TaxID=3299028 RepID=A0ABW7FTA6_9BURK
MRNLSRSSLCAQRGITSLLFVLMVGLGMGVMVMGAVHHVRGFQQQSVAVHAQTQAQLKAWSGVEALRQHLHQLSEAEAAALVANTDVGFNGLQEVSAKLITVVADDLAYCGGNTRLAFDVSGSSGQATSLLAAQFCVQGSRGGGSTAPTVNIKGDLRLSGDLKILGGNNSRVVVDGNVEGGGGLYGGVELYATGDIKLRGGTDFRELFAERDILLEGSGGYPKITALRNVTLTGTVSAEELNAMGTVTLAGNPVTALNAHGDVTLKGSAVAVLKTKGSVTAQNANISGRAEVQSNYSESSDGTVADGVLGGTLTVPGYNTKVKLTRLEGLQVAIPVFSRRAVTPQSFDANLYKSLANYVFESSGTHIRVTVRNVSGLPDGIYYLLGQADKQDRLCPTTTFDAARCVVRIAYGTSDNNAAITHAAGTWSVGGTGPDASGKAGATTGPVLAPGIYWFDGNVSAGNGNFVASWIATGDITTAANHVTSAPNYAGYSRVCTNPHFPKPLNLCPASGTELTYVPAANIAFAAGAAQPKGGYRGGNITVAANSSVYGDVIAGTKLTTMGSTRIFGYITAGSADAASQGATLSAETTIDLSDLPSNYKPGDNGPQPSVPKQARMIWARYR